MATDNGAVLEKLMARNEPLAEETQDLETETEEVTQELEETQELEAVDETLETDTDDVDESQDLTTDDLAGYLGIESDKLTVNDDGEVMIRTKVDGKEGSAKLDDLVKSYQLEGHLNGKSMEVSEQKKALDARQAELEGNYKGKLEQAENLVKLAYSELTKEYEGVNWDELEIDDPTEYTIKALKFQKRTQALEKAYNELTTSKPTVDKGKEIEALLGKIPEWSDESKADNEYRKVTDYASTQGYTPKEVSNFSDHRLIVLARKAMMFDELQKGKTSVKEKIKKAPKIVRPGAPKTADVSASKKRSKLLDKVKKTKGNRVEQKTALHDFLMDKYN